MMCNVREIHENNLQELSIFPSLKLSLLEEFIVEMGNALANPRFLVRPLRNAVIPGAVICNLSILLLINTISVQESSLALTEMRRVWKTNWVFHFPPWFSEYLMLVHLCSWWWRQTLNPSSDNWDWFRTHQIVGAIPFHACCWSMCYYTSQNTRNGLNKNSNVKNSSHLYTSQSGLGLKV